jgi:hypothetical protein
MLAAPDITGRRSGRGRGELVKNIAALFIP